MIVESMMITDVITVCPEETAAHALSLIHKNRIRHLPVVEKDLMIGMLSDRDLRSASPSKITGDNPLLLEQIKVKDIMKRPVITVHPIDFLEEAARLMYEHKIGCLPVVRGEKLVGIVTESDVLRTMVERMGLLQPGAHMEVEVPNRPGMLAKVAGIVQHHGVNIISALLFRGRSDDTQILILRLKALDLRSIVDDIESSGFTVLWPLSRDYGYER